VSWEAALIQASTTASNHASADLVQCAECEAESIALPKTGISL
jgi:hypothetical protein